LPTEPLIQQQSWVRGKGLSPLPKLSQGRGERPFPKIPEKNGIFTLGIQDYYDWDPAYKFRV